MQAWVFVAGCGLSSMFGAAATAFSHGPPTVNVVMLGERTSRALSAPQPSRPATPLCHDMTVHTALSRADVHNWLSSAQFLNESEVRLFAVAELGEPGLRIEFLAAGSLLNRIGLRSGDTIRSVQGVPVLSLRSSHRVLSRLIAQEPETMSVSFTRQGCITSLEVFL